MRMSIPSRLMRLSDVRVALTPLIAMPVRDRSASEFRVKPSSTELIGVTMNLELSTVVTLEGPDE